MITPPISCGKIFLTHNRTFPILPINKSKFLSINQFQFNFNYSCADAIAKAIERYIHPDVAQEQSEDIHKNIAETNGKGSDTVMVGVCPECHGPLEFESGCSVCRICGFSRCG